MKNQYLLVILMVAAGVNSSAQSNSVPLVLSLELLQGIETPPYVIAYYLAEINFDQLRELPESLSILLPEGESITVQRRYYEAREGYEYNDPPLPPFSVLPSATLEDMSYHWSGANDSNSNEVSITVYRGGLHVSIWVGNKKFLIDRITGNQDNNYKMYEVSGSILGNPVPQVVNTLSGFSLVMMFFLFLLVAVVLKIRTR